MVITTTYNVDVVASLLLITGIVLIVVMIMLYGKRTSDECPEPKVEIRYIKKPTLEDQFKTPLASPSALL